MILFLFRVTTLIVLQCSRVTVEHFQFAQIAISLILPIYVASKDFPELIVRLDKISTSTTVWGNRSVLYKEKVFIRQLTLTHCIALNELPYWHYHQPGVTSVKSQKPLPVTHIQTYRSDPSFTWVR